jgi:hypothetical protein
MEIRFTKTYKALKNNGISNYRPCTDNIIDKLVRFLHAPL